MKYLIVAAAAVCIAAPAFAGNIDFTGLANGTAVSNQFAGVTFSGSGGPGPDGSPLASNAWNGDVVELNNSTSGQYPTQQFVTATFSSVASNVVFDFANYGVNGTSYAEAYDSIGNVLGHIDLGFAGDYDTSYSFAFGDISKIVWSNGLNDSWEFGIRHVSFEAGAVPEPASWALMLGGFGLVGGAMRRRRKAAVSFG